MNLYLETSAALSWLFQETAGPDIANLLSSSQLVVTSRLTLVEGSRALSRMSAGGLLDGAACASLQGIWEAEARHWTVLSLGEEVLVRAGGPFPGEPLRTLDAIHVACALCARQWVADLEVVSLDPRVRLSASRLGFPVLPA